MWLPEAEETLALLWNDCEPYVIARVINAWLVRLFLIERKHKSAPLFTSNSVIDHAFRMGFIDEPTMIDMKRVERIARKRRDKEQVEFVTVHRDGVIEGRPLRDFEPRSVLKYPLDNDAFSCYPENDRCSG
jgi:hypothetical protein